MQINAFLENEYDDFSCDENFSYESFSDNLKRILKMFLADEEIYSKSCLKPYKFNTLEFDVVLCNDSKIQDINNNFRNKDKPTDVISFALFADSDDKFIFDGEINLGEIFISMDTAFNQANENNNSFEYEMNYLLSHGILHLLGFDHQTENDYNFMVEKQKLVLKDLNVKIQS